MKTIQIPSRVMNWSAGLLGVLCALGWPANLLATAPANQNFDAIAAGTVSPVNGSLTFSGVVYSTDTTNDELAVDTINNITGGLTSLGTGNALTSNWLTPSGTYLQFASVNNTNNFKIVSYNAEVFGHTSLNSEVYTIRGYDNGVAVASATVNFHVSGTYGTGTNTISYTRLTTTAEEDATGDPSGHGANCGTLSFTGSAWANIDQVRMTVADAPPNTTLSVSIDNPVFAAPVLPNTSPTFVGSTTTLTVGENSSANDLKSLLHVSDTDASQTETWSQSVAPSHGSLSFVSATAASGSANITPGGTITYTPTAGYAGSDSFTVQVSDGSGGSATRSLSVTVNPPTGLTSATATNGTYGSAFNYIITASNSPTSFGATGLPASLSLDPLTGIISGTLRQSGSFPVTLSATNATSYGTGVLTIAVAKVNLTVSGVVANNKVYDGTTNATLNLTGATLNGVVSGDSLSLNAAGATAAFATSAVGNGKAVMISGLGLSGTTATNYTLTQPTASANIAPAPATVLLSRSVQLYDGSAKTVTATTSPNGLAVGLTYNGFATAPSTIGTYTVIGTITDPNYSGSATNFLYVASAPQIVNVFTNGTGSLVFTWSAMPSVNYQVQYTPTLQPVSWTSLNGPVSATNTTMTTTDSINRSLLMRLYRVHLVLE